MKTKLFPLALAAVLLLTACSPRPAPPVEPETVDPAGTVPGQEETAPSETPEETAPPESPEDAPPTYTVPDVPSFCYTNECMLTVFPEEYRERIEPHTWDACVKAAFTDGEVVVVPNMLLTDIPQSFMDTLTCTSHDVSFWECIGEEGIEIYKDVLCGVYESEDLRITTVYYDPQKADLYPDTGIEYVRIITLLSDRFCTYQGIRLGDTAERCGTFDNESGRTVATPYLRYEVRDGILVELSATSFTEIEALNISSVFLFPTDWRAERRTEWQKEFLVD